MEDDDDDGGSPRGLFPPLLRGTDSAFLAAFDEVGCGTRAQTKQRHLAMMRDGDDDDDDDDDSEQTQRKTKKERIRGEEY